MRIRADIFERAPMVWLLLGLLLISGGLYLGFERKLAFVYMLVGIFCALYGPLLYFFKKREQPKHASSERTLSRDFISVGSTVAMPVREASEGESRDEPEHRAEPADAS